MPKTNATAVPSDGHRLFEAWLCSAYGTSKRTGRPAYAGMCLFHHELQAHMRERAYGLAPIRRALTVYTWFATAAPGVHRRPNRGHRLAIESMSRGAVPASAWGRP